MLVQRVGPQKPLMSPGVVHVGHAPLNGTCEHQHHDPHIFYTQREICGTGVEKMLCQCQS